MGSGHMTDYHDTIIRRLEDAGRTLMMLPMPKGGMPAGDSAAWPGVVQNYWDVIAVRGTNETAVEAKWRRETEEKRLNAAGMRAGRKAITRLDEVLEWLLMIERPHHRKAVMARMLVHPVSERPVHSWAQIAETMGTNRRTARHWYDSGVQSIIMGLATK